MKQAPVPSQVHPTDLLLCLLGHFGSHSRWGGIGCFDHFAFDLCRNHVQCIQFGWLSWIKIRRLLVQSNKYTLIIHRPSFYLYIYMASPFILIKCNLELLLSTCCPLASWTKGTSEVCPFAFRWSRPEGTLGVATPAMDLKEAPTLASKAANSDRIWWFGVSNMSRLLFSTCFHQLAAPDLKFIAWKNQGSKLFWKLRLASWEGNTLWHT